MKERIDVKTRIKVLAIITTANCNNSLETLPSSHNVNKLRIRKLIVEHSVVHCSRMLFYFDYIIILVMMTSSLLIIPLTENCY